MATAWSYIPLIGDFSAAGFYIKNDVGTVIPRSATSTVQGNPRPGVLKWHLSLANATPNTAGDNKVVIYVPTPFSFTSGDLSTKVNSYLPIVTLYGSSAEFTDQEVYLFTTIPAVDSGGLLDPDGNCVAVTIQIAAATTDDLDIGVVIDFSHSLIN